MVLMSKKLKNYLKQMEGWDYYYLSISIIYILWRMRVFLERMI